MSEKAKQRYEETKNMGSETVDGKVATPIYDRTKEERTGEEAEKQLKAATPVERGEQES